jgi:hypothetical protein
MGMEATKSNQNLKSRERLNHPKKNPDDGRGVLIY